MPSNEIDHEIVIVGAGFAGIGIGIALDKADIPDYLIVEDGGGLGGTWYWTTYPGVAVDIPSFSYQYPFEKRSGWSPVYAPGEELHACAEDCAVRHSLHAGTRFDTRVTSAEFDGERHVWRLDTTGGQITVRHLIDATGVLTQPRTPDIDGVDSFAELRPDRDVRALGAPPGSLRPAGRGHWHRRVGSAADSGHRGGRRAPDRVPAHSDLASAQGRRRDPVPGPVAAAPGAREAGADPAGQPDRGGIPLPVGRALPGAELGKWWAEHRHLAYEGVSGAGVPNYFLMCGPYSYNGSSYFNLIESQARHIVRCLTHARARKATRVEVTARTNDEYFATMLRRGRNQNFWRDSCALANSYYFDANGDVPPRPSPTLETIWRSTRFPLRDYEFATR